jgi:Cu/Ag efflux protein CusF
MRRLAVMTAAALLAAGTATADDRVGSTSQETKEAGQAAARDTKKAGNQAKDWSKEQGQKADQKADAAGDRMQTTAQESNRTAASPDQRPATDAQARQADTKDQARDQMKKDSFDIEGKVSKVSAKQLTLSREDASMATLHVDRTTKVEVDGQQAKLSQLKPGQDVKASFNLKGDKPTAIEIKADKLDK